MTLSLRVYDRVWWIVAALSLGAVLSFDDSGFFRRIAPALLALALCATSFLAFFVQRGDSAASAESPVIRADGLSNVVEGEIAREEARLASVGYADLKVYVSHSFTQDVESIVGAVGILASNKGGTHGHQVWPALYPGDYPARRRNVLKEASALADALQGRGFAVHISPENEIAICKREVSQAWQMVEQEVGQINSSMPPPREAERYVN